ncbi:hypothetical protein NQ317_009284 [Molorchus minor]|uniref:Transmembrane protein 183 n=1 Tax=Molorchus minor TaxID=1323400 RepID=A0ABQ9JBP0_9CUCU|nr:hypothetical protein NQ317_009284 [Molorchus minor]
MLCHVSCLMSVHHGARKWWSQLFNFTMYFISSRCNINEKLPLTINLEVRKTCRIKSQENIVLPKNLGDVTLNDFANSAICKYRLKKVNQQRKHSFKKSLRKKKSWDEKIDDLEGDFEEQIDEEAKTSKKTISNSEGVKDGIGKDYPIDIWFTLSEYIRPEDVGVFASICKTSFEVTCTAKFWFSLYRLIPPFVTKLKSLMTSMTEHPDTLKRRQCDSLWQEKKRAHWVFYFKMREKKNVFLQHSSRTDYRQPDLLEILDDVSANPDETCRVLRVTCKHFIKIPPVIGQVLTSVCLTLSQGLRHHRLQLDFGSGLNGYPMSSLGGAGCNTIILDPVINYRILDWWHPLYPHNHNIQDLLSRE